MTWRQTFAGLCLDLGWVSAYQRLMENQRAADVRSFLKTARLRQRALAAENQRRRRNAEIMPTRGNRAVRDSSTFRR